MLGERECTQWLLCDLQQFVTLETSSITSCIFPVGVSFRNALWLNIVVRDATSVVCPYAYMAKWAITRLLESTDVQQTNLSGKNTSLFSSFLIHEVEIFSSVDEARHQAPERCRIVVSLRLQKLLLTRVKQQRSLMLLLTTVKQRRLLMLLLTTVFLLKISPTFWECLAARFKSFLPIVYTDDVHTTTLMVTAKWFFWLHSINAWRVRRSLKKKERERLR